MSCRSIVTGGAGMAVSVVTMGRATHNLSLGGYCARSIENGLHWVLDVVFREDARRLYDHTAAENVAFLNRLALSILRGDSSKGSLKVKRKRAGRNIQYLAQLLG